MADVNVYIEKDKFARMKDQAAKNWDDVDTDKKGGGYLFSFETKTEELDVNDIELATSYYSEENGIHVSITQSFNKRLTIKLTQVIINKLTKAKELFESLTD